MYHTKNSGKLRSTKIKTERVLDGEKKVSEKIVFEDKYKKDIDNNIAEKNDQPDQDKEPKKKLNIQTPQKEETAWKTEKLEPVNKQLNIANKTVREENKKVLSSERDRENKKENLTNEEELTDKIAQKVVEKISRPQQDIVAKTENNKTEEQKHEAVLKTGKLESVKKQLNTANKTAREENEKVLSSEIDKENKNENLMNDEKLPEKIAEKVIEKISQPQQDSVAKDEVKKIEEQKNEAKKQVEKLKQENKQLKTEKESVQNKMQKISSITVSEPPIPEKPTNEEKIDIIGGVGGIMSTVVEQLTGTGEFATGKDKQPQS